MTTRTPTRGRLRRLAGATVAGVVALGVSSSGAAHAQTATPPPPIPVEALCAEVPAGYQFFADIGEDQTFATAYIRCMAAAGITFGVAPGTYAPQETINRAQMASFLARMLDRAVELQVGDDLLALPPYSGVNAFPDVADDDVHTASINRLSEAGITTGGPGDLPSSMYGPSLAVTRAQMAGFVARSLEHLTGTPRSSDEDFFTDDDDSVHEDDIDGLAEAGIAVGTGGGLFRPGDALNRGQMSAFIMRSMADLEAGGAITPLPLELPTSVSVTDDAVTDQDGKLVLSIDQLPDQVEPEEGTAFGGPTRFTDAVLSGDGRWVAIGSAGAAHGYGWLHDIVAGEHHLVDFQFGGGVTAHSWSPDARFAVFVVASPAATDLLKVVDRDDIAPYAADTGYVVEVDQEAGLEPPFSYAVTEWQAPHTLCFELEGTPYCLDAATGEVD